MEHVTFRYLEQSKRPVLDEVSASFDRSRITVLTGPSGCGKSTLLYLAAGMYPQNAGFLQGGTVRVEGQEPAALGPGERCALVGMLFQNPELQFCMDTVENELFFCLENRRVPRAEMEERLSAALDFCGIAHLRRRPLRSLSGGEKQRAALACLAALRPAWVLLDEPFANLDDQTAALLCGQLARLHRECGTGILAIDHRLDHWLSIADDPPHGPGRHAGRRRLCPQRPLPSGVGGAGRQRPRLPLPGRPAGQEPGRRRWCSPCGACGSPRMGARCCGT